MISTIAIPVCDRQSCGSRQRWEAGASMVEIVVSAISEPP